MNDYVKERDLYVITLENGKVVKVLQKFINEHYIEPLGLDEEDAILTYLEDEEFLINDEQEELNDEAKNNKYKVNAEKGERKKREVVRKANPEKEMIIAQMAELCKTFGEDVVIENVGKIITFRIGEQKYKVDLIAQRAKKGE